jgi:hypothetical protein
MEAWDEPPRTHSGNPIVLDMWQRYSLIGGTRYVQPSGCSCYVVVAEVLARTSTGAKRGIKLVVFVDGEWSAMVLASNLTGGGDCTLEADGSIIPLDNITGHPFGTRLDLARNGQRAGDSLMARSTKTLSMALAATLWTDAVGVVKPVKMGRIEIGLGGTAEDFARWYTGEVTMKINLMGVAYDALE